MRVVPFAHEGLGNSSYLVEFGERRALLIDPDRTFARYLAYARSQSLTIEAVFETHLHADFVSGAHEALGATGSRLFLASDAKSKLPHQPVQGGDVIDIEGLRISVIASPGHTPEHLAYVVDGAAGPPQLFSGGSLIVGGAARTDLISEQVTEQLTRAQFRSLHTAFSHLPDETVLLPTHGGGSFCSTGGGAERSSTLGQERAMNPVLLEEDEEGFLRWFPAMFPGIPSYYWRMRAINQRGPRLVAEISRPPVLGAAEFREEMASCLVIDTRNREDYARAHIPGSLSIPFRDSFAVWLGWLAPEDARLLFVAEPDRLDDVIDQSLLVGFERFEGYLRGGVEGWRRAGLEIKQVSLSSPREASGRLTDDELPIDVREPDEFAGGHIEGARSIPLGRLQAEVGALPKDRPAIVYCGVGDRASSAASILERAGVQSVVSLAGGIEAWEAEHLPLTR